MPASLQLRGHPLAIFRPRLLADAQRRRASAGGRAASAAGTTSAKIRAPWLPPSNQQLDRCARLRRPVFGPGDGQHRRPHRVAGMHGARLVGRAQPGGRGEPGRDPRDAAAPAADWRGRARRSARGSRSERRAGSRPASSGPTHSRRTRPPHRATGAAASAAPGRPRRPSRRRRAPPGSARRRCVRPRFARFQPPARRGRRHRPRRSVASTTRAPAATSRSASACAGNR